MLAGSGVVGFGVDSNVLEIDIRLQSHCESDSLRSRTKKIKSGPASDLGYQDQVRMKEWR